MQTASREVLEHQKEDNGRVVEATALKLENEISKKEKKTKCRFISL
jgi:hypothetical protein